MDESPEAHGHPYTAADPLQIGPHICKFSDEICTTISHGLVFLTYGQIKEENNFILFNCSC